MSDLPAPIIQFDVDLRALDSFMMNVDRLMTSELWALSTGDEFKAAFALWCRAWKQVPAGSLPNDERTLAAFSCAGTKWKKVKDMALRGFILCSDGRLYHPVLCEDAQRAWKSRQQRKEAIAKRWEKSAPRPDSNENPAVPRTFENDTTVNTTVSVAVKTPELRGAYQGQGQGHIPPNPPSQAVSEATPAKGEVKILTEGKLDEVRKVIWRLAGLSEDQIGTKLTMTSREGLSQIRSWLELGLTTGEMIEIAVKAFDAKEADGGRIDKPWSYLDAVMRRIADDRDKPNLTAADHQDPKRDLDRQKVKRFVEAGKWFSHFGPRPGEPGCEVDADILAEFGLGFGGSRVAPERKEIGHG